ncbi:MAG: hypothetical protein AB1714_16235 [Acidobacteriota bacterium]
MNDPLSSRKAVPVMLAATFLVLLAGSLAVRLFSRDQGTTSSPKAAAANVPDPRAIELKNLGIPYWAGPEAEKWPLRFRTDLDALAPLGTGPANAAIWFKDFTKVPAGARLAEFEAAKKRFIVHPTLGNTLPADDPLVREAEPWCEQATMRFYPEFFKIQGLSTGIPNLILPITLAKSYVARGMTAADDAAALADFRRAIRLGRLLRQEDFTIVADLVGLACIRIGTEAIYDRARAIGDTRLALVAAVIASEAGPQKLLTRVRLTEINLFGRINAVGSDQIELSAGDTEIETVIQTARTGPDRRFRGEAVINLGVARFWGTPPQQELARRALDELASDKDLLFAELARYCRDNRTPTAELLEAAQVMK